MKPSSPYDTPDSLKDAYDLDAELLPAHLSYCVLTTPGDAGAAHNRFPESGWLEGSLADVAELPRLISVPQSAVNVATDAFEGAIDRGAALLKGISEDRPASSQAIANLLGMNDVPKTHRMACTIVANAMVLHGRVATMHECVKPAAPGLRPGHCKSTGEHQRGLVVHPQQYQLLADICYRARHRRAAAYHRGVAVIRVLQHAAGDVAASGANAEHDLTGRVFQRLIIDRKYLATFYTLPAPYSRASPLKSSNHKLHADASSASARFRHCLTHRKDAYARGWQMGADWLCVDLDED